MKAFHEIDAGELATKGDLREVEAKVATADDIRGIKDDIRGIEAELAKLESGVAEFELRLEAKIEVAAATLKADTLRWLFAPQIALGGFIFAAFKYLR